MGDRQCRGIYSVLSYEEPAREALFNIVEPIARGCLRELHPLNYCISSQNPLQLWS